MLLSFMFRFTAVTMALMLSLQVYAAPTSGKDATNTSKSATPSKHLATILFAGVAGAILGLSTLSFYGRPQDRLSNIAVGFAVGIIGGAIYTTYKAASEPRDFYGLRDRSRPQVAFEPPSERTMLQPMPKTGFNLEF